MKHFLTKLFLFLIPFGVMAVVNYNLDNAYIFSGEKKYKQISKIISEGHNVANLYNFNEIELYKNLVKKLKKRPEILVLGSSRSMEISKKLFQNRNIFNESISESSLKEIIAAYGLFEKYQGVPEMVILNIDPHIMLNSETSNYFRSEFTETFNYMAGKLNTEPIKNNTIIKSKSQDFKNKLKELFNPGYFFENIYYGYKDFYQTDENSLDVNILCSDGSISYNKNYREISPEKSLVKAEDYIKRIRKTKAYQHFENENVRLFYKFINYLQKKTKIIFYLSPYHPIVAKELKRPVYKVYEMEKEVINLASKVKIPVFGNYDPDKLNINKKCFYDGNHAKRITVEEILQNIDNYCD